MKNNLKLLWLLAFSLIINKNMNSMSKAAISGYVTSGKEQIKILIEKAEESFKQSFFWENFIKRDDQLYTSGSRISERLSEYVEKKTEIKTIINLSKKYEPKLKKLCEKLNIQYHYAVIPCSEIPEKEELFKILKIINDSDKPVLIISKDGCVRPGIVAMIWFLIKQTHILNKILEKNIKKALEKTKEEYVSLALDALSFESWFHYENRKFIKTLALKYTKTIIKNLNIFDKKNNDMINELSFEDKIKLLKTNFDKIITQKL